MAGMAEPSDVDAVRARSFGAVAASHDTSSAHLILPPEVRDSLTTEVTATLTGYGDDVELAMVTDLVTAVRR
jgi:hypothetical protein